MKRSHAFVTYLVIFFVTVDNIPEAICGERRSEHPGYESKYARRSEYPAHEPKHDYHHYEHHPPPKKSPSVDINIPIDFGTIAKLGVLGLTKLKLLMALGKVAGAGLGISTLGLGQLGKLALKVAPVHKGGISIDLGGGHHQAKSHAHYEPVQKHY